MQAVTSSWKLGEPIPTCLILQMCPLREGEPLSRFLTLTPLGQQDTPAWDGCTGWGSPCRAGEGTRSRSFCLLAWSEQLGTGSLWEACLSRAGTLPRPLGRAELGDRPNFVLGWQGEAVPSRPRSRGSAGVAGAGDAKPGPHCLQSNQLGTADHPAPSPWRQRGKKPLFPTLVGF